MQAALDATYGERVRIEPQGGVGWRGSSGADAARQPCEIVGRFRQRPMTSELEGNREGAKLAGMTRFAGNRLTLRISPAEAARIGYDLALDDRIVLVERADQPAYKLGPVGRGDSGELMIGLLAA